MSTFFATDFVNLFINLFAIAPLLVIQTTAMRYMNIGALTLDKSLIYMF